MDGHVEPTTLVEIQNALRETFGIRGCKFNPKGDDEKVYTFDAKGIS